MWCVKEGNLSYFAVVKDENCSDLELESSYRPEGNKNKFHITNLINYTFVTALLHNLRISHLISTTSQ
jgi:hypothetical protein